MANPFVDTRLPEDVERGASGGPGFKTTIVILGNGTEQRNRDWDEARGKWDISYGIDTKEAYSEVREFFYARRGKHVGFRYKDWSDYQLEDELIGTGNGAQTVFPMKKTYSAASGPYVRRITRPVNGTLTVRVNDVVVTNYTVNYSTGVITFDAAVTNAHEVRIDVEFDVPARFDSDEFSIILEPSVSGAIGSLIVIEIRE